MSQGLRRIFLSTNLEAAAEPAFQNALRLAVAGPATLTLMHVGEEIDESLSAMPRVRNTLRKWGNSSGTRLEQTSLRIASNSSLLTLMDSELAMTHHHHSSIGRTLDSRLGVLASYQAAPPLVSPPPLRRCGE